MDGKVMRCPFCGKLYEVSDFYVGDQGCCPGCRAEAKKNMGTYEAYGLANLFGGGMPGKKKEKKEKVEKTKTEDEEEEEDEK